MSWQVGAQQADSIPQVDLVDVAVKKFKINFQESARKKEKVRFSLFPTKSGLMLGLGETQDEVLAVLRDLRAHDVTRVSLGQYLRPSLQHLPVMEYIHPDMFEKYEVAARDMGFAWVKAGPMVRSSYFAEEQQNA